jgi:hypothetical protein
VPFLDISRYFDFSVKLVEDPNINHPERILNTNKISKIKFKSDFMGSI